MQYFGKYRPWYSLGIGRSSERGWTKYILVVLVDWKKNWRMRWNGFYCFARGLLIKKRFNFRRILISKTSARNGKRLQKLGKRWLADKMRNLVRIVSDSIKLQLMFVFNHRCLFSLLLSADKHGGIKLA